MSSTMDCSPRPSVYDTLDYGCRRKADSSLRNDRFTPCPASSSIQELVIQGVQLELLHGQQHKALRALLRTSNRSEICWAWRDVRQYAFAQWELIRQLRKLSTPTATSVALSQIFALLRLSPSDQLSIRFAAPGLMIRLGLDEEAYAFLIMHNKPGQHCYYAWSEISIQASGPGSIDLFESLDKRQWNHASTTVSTQMAVLLLKLRLYLHLRDLENCQIIGQRLPLELYHMVRTHLIGTAATVRRSIPALREEISLRSHIQLLELQLSTLYAAIGNSNQRVWTAVLSKARCNTCSQDPGGVNDVRLDADTKRLLEDHYDAWAETSGALKWLKMWHNASGGEK